VEKISLSESKTLKLTNVVIIRLDISHELELSTAVNAVDNYIKSKGTQPVGPLVQKIVSFIDDNGAPQIKFYIIRQCKDNIVHIDEPYEFISVLRCKDCLFAHFVDEEKNIKFAYDKLGVYAYENEINLKNETYTVFVNKINDNIIADIFMERK
jgi:hypothetical protein